MEEKKIVLFSTFIDDYDQLRNDYVENCEINKIEPKEGGELEWYNDYLEMDYEEFKYEMKRLEMANPHSQYLCVGTSGLWYGKVEGGIVCSSLTSIIDDLVSYVDDYEFSLNEEGQIEFVGAHHDGRNYYTIIMLNLRANKVIEKAENNYESLVGNRSLSEKLSSKFFKKKIVDGKDIYK